MILYRHFLIIIYLQYSYFFRRGKIIHLVAKIVSSIKKSFSSVRKLTYDVQSKLHIDVENLYSVHVCTRRVREENKRLNELLINS